MPTPTPLAQLGDQGVSVWVDSIARDGYVSYEEGGPDAELAERRLGTAAIDNAKRTGGGG